MGAVKSEYWDELMKRLDEEDGYVPDEEEELKEVASVKNTTIVSINVNVPAWNCDSNETHIGEEAEKIISHARAMMPIEYASHNSDGFFRPTPDEATTIYLPLYLGAFTDSDETIISISFKECMNETMRETNDDGLYRLETEITEILADIALEKAKRQRKKEAVKVTTTTEEKRNED
tara:strand:+ start:2448 stop:2978 length:531 start_codon:yes stop_codon:yes gene_type:complete